jgi:hypothetical protein
MLNVMKYIDKKVHDDKSLKVGEFIDLDLIVTTTKETLYGFLF